MLHAFGHHVATSCELKVELVRIPKRNIVARTWPNDYSIMQHPQMLHEKFDHFQIWANNTQHVATCGNRVAKRTQHVASNNVAICCVEMLRSFGRGFMFNPQEDRGCLSESDWVKEFWNLPPRKKAHRFHEQQSHVSSNLQRGTVVVLSQFFPHRNNTCYANKIKNK